MKAITILKEILLFVVLILFQVLLFNRIALFGVAVPVLYIYFLIKLPVSRNRYYVIVFAFLMGLVIDIFLNTPGVNATATTIVATFRGVILHLFYPKVEFENHTPGIHGFTAAFIKYTITMVVFHQILLFFIESVTLFNIIDTLIRIGTSSLLTIVIILVLDSLSFRKGNTIG